MLTTSKQFLEVSICESENWPDDMTTSCKVLSALVGLLKFDLELQNEFEKLKDSFEQD
jgi:hypothetical protein